MNFPPNDKEGSPSWKKWFQNITYYFNWTTPTFSIPLTVTGTLDLSQLQTVPGNAILYFSTTMTGNVSITMPQPTSGATMRVTHASAGGHTINVGGLKTISNGQWAHFVSDGSVWYEIAFGSL
jgi:hypothetical protein